MVVAGKRGDCCSCSQSLDLGKRDGGRANLPVWYGVPDTITVRGVGRKRGDLDGGGTGAYNYAEGAGG